jgi:hypothetical protein
VPIPSVHIYPLSRLVHASAGGWESQLRAIEENKLYANRYYAPLRNGVIAYCRKGAPKHEQILTIVGTQASLIKAPRGSDPVKDNVAAFETFADKFYSRISKFGRSFLHEDLKGCAFEGVRLLGLPHFSATDSNGRDRYVYLHASKWQDDDTKAYLELLSVVIEDKFAGSPDSLWCMDLRTGSDLKWRSSARLRSRCANAARLYARLIHAMTSA